MSMKRSFLRVDLQRLILWMCLFFVLLALGNSLYAAYKVQREILLHNTLELNRVYANKLAQVTEHYLRSSRQMLESVATEIAQNGAHTPADQEELMQLSRMTENFNSLFISDAHGMVTATVPSDLGLRGTALRSEASLRMLEHQGGGISDPFLAPSGRWLIMIAHPIIMNDGSYGGFVGGTIYLHAANALQATLGQHYYKDGSSLYVVDQIGRYIYHPSTDYIGAASPSNPVIQALRRGEEGARRITSRSNVDMLAGFAPVASTGWGIVAQRPTDSAMSRLDDLFWRSFYYSLPMSVACLLGIWWLARLIARPLRELAQVAANLDNRVDFERIKFIKGWYLEAALIRKALLAGFSAVALRLRKLSHENATDPLTALTNRRGLSAAFSGLQQAGRSASVVLFDVDHFKAVNDTHGHARGDEVLKSMALIALAQARKEDVVARLGGEEFVVLLPDATPESASLFAERLRMSIALTDFERVGKVTVSLGIAHFPSQGDNLDAVLDHADSALYRAKREGRNRVCEFAFSEP